LSASSAALTSILVTGSIVVGTGSPRPNPKELTMRKHLAVAGIALGSILGGATLGTVVTPAVSGAQEAPATDADGDAAQHPGRPGGPGLDVAADAIGIEIRDLCDALRAGQTIAEVATAHGVDVQTVIDAMVADATEHITARVNGTEQPPPPPARVGYTC
jgi:hypothetical protein